MKRVIKLTVFSVLVFAFTISCKKKEDDTKGQPVAEAQSDENFRPNFHFTPKENWMNDPNGMFYLNGTYHLYFQYYPEGNTWGPMHWGHATSKDMITWEEQPVALEPDEKGYIFSGSAVVDTENTSGLGDGTTPPVIAMFTYHDPEKEKKGEIDYQTQAIAYSLDEGMTWTKYEGNPVIENPGIRDFRDPKVVWDEEHKQWVMVLAANDQSLLYTSPNLLDWNLASEFGKGTGAHGGVWECPDFFPMKVEGTDETKWVLIQSLNPGAYNGGSGTQYFVGDFDGKEFTPVKEMQKLEEKHSYWIDFGKDNYAGVTWANIPEEDGRKLFIGWMSNWQYAQKVPTETWRSSMTIARELKLEKEDSTYRITSLPVEELKSYRSSSHKDQELTIEGNTTLINSDKIDLSRADIRFKISDLKEIDYRFSLSNSMGEKLVFGYDHADKNFYIDRSKSGITDFSEDFGNSVSKAPRISNTDELDGIIILDKTSIELFFDEGKTVLTEIFFPEYPLETLSVSSGDNDFIIDEIVAYELKLSEARSQTNETK